MVRHVCVRGFALLFALDQLPSRLHVDSLEYVRALNTAPAPGAKPGGGVRKVCCVCALCVL
jgi:hypothetical protein